MTDFQVQPTDLYAHGSRVLAVADAVDEALSAGQAVRAGAGAYGQLCTLVPVLLGALQDALADGIADSARSLRDTGDALRAVAAGYELTDEDVSRSLRAP